MKYGQAVLFNETEMKVLKEHFERLAQNDGDIGAVFWPKILNKIELQQRALESAFHIIYGDFS